MAIEASPLERTATEVAHWIHESPASVSSALAKLAASGCVTRRMRSSAQAYPHGPKGHNAWVYSSTDAALARDLVSALRRGA